ncbi:MAG: M24 family metallopeptidase [Candidatus Bipolaricaulia bacterium]
MKAACAPYAEFPETEYRSRFEKAQQVMAERGLDTLLVTGKENVVYFTGLQTIGWMSKHRPLGAILLRDIDTPILVIPESLFSVAEATSWIEDVRYWGGTRFPDVPRDPIDAIVAAIVDLSLNRARVGMELGYGQRLAMPQNDYEALKRALPALEIVDGSDALWQLRMVKSPAEVEAIRAACNATSTAFETAFEAIHEGMTERELGRIILQEMSQTGYPPGFIMVRSGRDKYKMINVPPFDKPLNKGDLVVVDAGATYKDYWADFMRMASIGGPTEEQRRYFEADLAAQQAGVEVIRPGIPGKRIFEAAAATLKDLGMEQQARIERIGHGVGLDVHEPPSLDGKAEFQLEPGMILTVEPIFTDPEGKIGNFALEDMVLVTEDGYEILSTFPKELWIA